MDEKEVKLKIGKRIQSLRQAAGYTQQTFAELIGLSTNYLSDIERGISTPRMDKFAAIMNALNCSADDLFRDVINNGYKVRASRLAEIIEALPREKREKAFAILEAYVSDTK